MNTISNCPVCDADKFSDLIKTKAQMHPSKETFQFQQCKSCDLVFLNPRLPQEMLKDYYTEYYLPYRGPKAWGPYQSIVASSQKALDRKRVSFVNQYHALNNDTKVLDLGCGNPTFLEACFDEFSCDSYGLDFSDEGWKDEKVRFNNLNLTTGEIHDYPNDVRPDVITMWHYLEHDYNPEKTLQKLHSIATKKTSLFIEVPNYDSDSRRRFNKHWAGYHTPRHTFLFSPENIKMLLKKTGWKVRELNTYGTLDPYNLYWMSEMEKRKIDWSKSMASEFTGYVIGKLRFFPNSLSEKKKSLGIMTVVAEKQ